MFILEKPLKIQIFDSCHMGKECIMYEIVFVNFWIKFCVRSSYIKTLKKN